MTQYIYTCTCSQWSFTFTYTRQLVLFTCKYTYNSTCYITWYRQYMCCYLKLQENYKSTKGKDCVHNICFYLLCVFFSNFISTTKVRSQSFYIMHQVSEHCQSNQSEICVKLCSWPQHLRPTFHWPHQESTMVR